MNLKKILSCLFLVSAHGFNLNRRNLIRLSAPLLKINNYKDDNENNIATLIQEQSNDIYFYGSVTPETCFALRSKLNEISERSKRFSLDYKTQPFPIYLHIQSGGGSLFPVLYIIDLIKDNNIPIYTCVDGFAASAATLISVVGAKRYMTKNSLMLIHQLSSGTDVGKYSEIKDQVQNMDSLMRIIINTYKENTNMTDNELFELLQKDIWLNSTECLKYGLVDEII